MLAADLLRLFAGATILAFASWTDWKWRRAPNVLWIVLAGVGLLALALEAATDFAAVRDRWTYLALVPVLVGFFYAAWWFGLIAGGADAKALMAFAVLLPWPLAVEGVTLWATPVPGAFAVFGNSLLVFLLVPIAYALRNVVRGDLRFPHVLLGVRIPVDSVGAGHSWPMEQVEEGRVVTRLFASKAPEVPPEELREALKGAGLTRVWVTPKVPFMIPLLLGFVLAFAAGDLLTTGIVRVVGGGA